MSQEPLVSRGGRLGLVLAGSAMLASIGSAFYWLGWKWVGMKQKERPVRNLSSNLETNSSHRPAKSESHDSDYAKGFDDALKGQDCRPSSLNYVSGYEHGRRASLIGSGNGHAMLRRGDD